MKFNLCLGNFAEPQRQPSAIFLTMSVAGDMVQFLRRALEDAGHEVTVNATFVDETAVNIFWERFRDFSDGRDYPAEMKKRGVRFGLVCTEPMNTPGLFNPFDRGEEVARAHYQQFVHTLKHAEFVWYILEEAAPFCREHHANSSFLPYGFVARYAELGRYEERHFQNDFILQGAPTVRRSAIADRLRERGCRVTANPFYPEYIRMAMLEASRVALSVQKSDRHQIFSLARIAHAIINRVPMLVEYDGPPCYLSKYCVVARPAEFIDTCVEFIGRPDLARHAQDMYDRFASEMPMQPRMTQILRDTFGADAEVRGAAGMRG